MQILISNTSAEPLYAQISQQIRRAVLTRELAPGEAMPSIRYLARELKVSVITAKRAYDDLEVEGFLATTPGRGTFISTVKADRLREVAVSQMEEKLAQALDAARAIGLTLEQVIETVTTIYHAEEGTK